MFKVSKLNNDLKSSELKLDNLKRLTKDRGREFRRIVQERNFYKEKLKNSSSLPETFEEINELKDQVSLQEESIQEDQSNPYYYETEAERLEYIEFKSLMRGLILELKIDILSELSAYLGKRCYGMKDVWELAIQVGKDKREIDTFIYEYLNQQYNINIIYFKAN